MQILKNFFTFSMDSSKKTRINKIYLKKFYKFIIKENLKKLIQRIIKLNIQEIINSEQNFSLQKVQLINFLSFLNSRIDEILRNEILYNDILQIYYSQNIYLKDFFPRLRNLDKVLLFSIFILKLNQFRAILFINPAIQSDENRDMIDKKKT